LTCFIFSCHWTELGSLKCIWNVNVSVFLSDSWCAVCNIDVEFWQGVWEIINFSKCPFCFNIPHYLKLCFDKNCIFIFQLNEWKTSTNNSFTYKVLPITFPLQENTDEWRKLFKPCASQRLFLPVSIIQLK